MKNPISSSFAEGFDCSLIYTVLSDTNPWVLKSRNRFRIVNKHIPMR